MDKKAKAEDKRARRTQRKLDAANGIVPSTPLPFEEIDGEYSAADPDAPVSDDA